MAHKKMKVDLVIGKLGSKRHFRACARTIGLGRVKIGGPHHLRDRHEPTCESSNSPRHAIAGALRKLAAKINGRRGHKRFGRR